MAGLTRLSFAAFHAEPLPANKKNRGPALDSFLEGPSFDRQGKLWCVDIPFGRIFRINAKGEWQLAAQYDGWPGVGVWRFDANFLPTHLVHAGKQHRLMTNIAFQGKRLYITDSLNGGQEAFLNEVTS